MIYIYTWPVFTLYSTAATFVIVCTLLSITTPRQAAFQIPLLSSMTRKRRKSSAAGAGNGDSDLENVIEEIEATRVLLEVLMILLSPTYIWTK
jgi:hypothetical protein